jgi:HAD superfamily hydrolase (TIGR01662 family)
MVTEIENAGGRIDQIYYCPHLSVDNSFYRKPNVGMAMMAKEEFPGIIFEQSIMIGDSNSDILFGKNSGMHTILIEGKIESLNGIPITKPDLKLPNLYEFGAIIKRKIELL